MQTLDSALRGEDVARTAMNARVRGDPHEYVAALRLDQGGGETSSTAFPSYLECQSICLSFVGYQGCNSCVAGQLTTCQIWKLMALHDSRHCVSNLTAVGLCA